MFRLLQVTSLMLVAVAMAMALAHALELPGKLRLSRQLYAAVQPIYYPGFTIGGGIGETGGLVATLLLVLVTPFGSIAFWLTLGAWLLLAAMHAVYWLFTHPVNRFWLEGQSLARPAAGFFALGAGASPAEGGALDWMALRDQWEYSHVSRAVLGTLSLALLATAVSL